MSYSALFELRSEELRSEAEVETRLLARLFERLGYPPAAVIPKTGVEPLLVASGRRQARIRPDFLLRASTGHVKVLVEAKDPRESVQEAWGQAAGYALSYNAARPAEARIRWIIISNGYITSLYQHDSALPTLTLRLSDFVSGSPPYAALRSLVKYQTADAVAPAALGFDIVAPAALNAQFDAAHQLIWRKQKLSPTDAFFEFCKFMFLKITEDKKREIAMAEGRVELFPLTTQWLIEQRATSPHPVRDLFHRLRDELEAQIPEGKKRIFDPGETLRLSAETCRELIVRFERINLSSIDEDLNGRMFEVFLNEAVRGKELGQYFTPRSIVDFMARIGLHSFQDVRSPPKVLDACCGTAGFLIEAMAYQVAAIANDTRLQGDEPNEIERRIKNQLLFGIEANERVSRVARINMYLHGDGGSHIFHGDGLDNDPEVSDDMIPERRRDVQEHRAEITEGSFDLILTNPPFSMTYSVNEPDEDRILAQLRAWDEQEARSDAEITAQLDAAASMKSNILFMFRYYKLLRDGGEMLIVIDDTLLNGDTLLTVRRWILDHFVLLGVHSLPFNAFFKAKANIKTSILHLRKKTGAGTVQGHVFMSSVNNVGHDNALRDTPERNNLNDVLNVWLDWQRTGQFEPIIRYNQDRDENLESPEEIWLTVPGDLNVARLDAFFYSPELKRVREQLRAEEVAGQIEIHLGRDFEQRARLSAAEVRDLAQSRQVLKYFEIGDVTRYGLIVSTTEGTIDELPARGRYRVAAGDILVAINNSSRGTVVEVPEDFDGAICTTGFLVITPRSQEEGRLLWYALRSEAARKQIYYLAQTASQPELKQGAWADLFMVPFPVGEARARALAEADEFQRNLRTLLHADSVRLQIGADAPPEAG
jgi:type I restriction enzyme M protein